MTVDQFDISPFGFLQYPCVKHLDIFTDLEEEMQTRKAPNFREFVRHCYANIKTVSIDSYSVAELKYIYSLLSMVLHKYVWCNLNEPISSVPHNIGLLWWHAANKIGIAPVLTHGSVDLYNWDLKNPDEPFSLDNIVVNYSITGDKSEHWFYMIMIAIEGMFGELFNEVLKLDVYIETGDSVAILDFLINFGKKMKEINSCFKRIYEQCDPDYFFNTLRIYLHGSARVDSGNGLKIEKTDIVLNYTGGSAAQSTLVQLWDVLFSVTHDEHSTKFLTEMQSYMPMKHLEFYNFIKSRRSLMEYIESTGSWELQWAANDCIKLIKKFRQIHFSVVHSYVFKFVGLDHIKIPLSKEEIEKVNNDIDESQRGTGRTNPIVFLSSMFNDTLLKNMNRLNISIIYGVICVVCTVGIGYLLTC